MHDPVSPVQLAARGHCDLLDVFVADHAETLDTAAAHCAETLRSGGKLLIFGNGGSAAQAQHLAAEFVGQFDRPRRPLAAIALTTDGPTLTCVGNDSGFDEVFARQIQALGRPGDLALGFSTSGRSANIVAAFERAGKIGLRTVAILGGSGEPAASAAELTLIVDGTDTARIQEVQLFASHVLCTLVQHRLGLALQSTDSTP